MCRVVRGIVKSSGCLVTITFFKIVPYRMAVMNDGIRKFVYDSMQQRTRKDKNNEKDLTKNL